MERARAAHDPQSIEDLVLATRRGESRAWEGLIGRFQNLAMALALGQGGWEGAEDVAQEAFVLAFRHLGSLEEPRAFPAWLATLVRTASSRRSRRRQLVRAYLDPNEPIEDPGPGPDVAHDAAEELRRVRDAIEALPVGERTVIALHYLADMSYPEIAGFLDISPAAAKKRAFSARRRMKETLPMATDALSAQRPSRSESFRDTVLLFAAIRDADHDAVAGLLAKDPSLVRATEDWSVDEAIDAALGVAQKASPLIRAAQVGDVALVRLLVEAGASLGEPCACAGAETALWSAVVFGNAEVVDYLLEQGADPNAVAFAGATPLHAAAQRGHNQIFTRLLAAGAEPERTDDQGRRPADWLEVERPRHQWPPGQSLLPTGIRAIDLFAPLRQGGLVYFPPAYGLGQVVALFQMADHIRPDEFFFIGFASGGYEPQQVLHGVKEMGVDCHILLADQRAEASAQREVFAGAVNAVLASSRPGKLVVCQEAPGYAHDVTLALPRLAADPSVLAALVVSPFTGTYPKVSPEPPEGFDGQVAFSTTRARRLLYPAIDPATTVSRWFPNDRHHRLATDARALLADYGNEDPTLELPDPGTLPDPDAAARAQALIRMLAQPFRVAESFTSLPGEYTPVDELLDTVAALIT